MVGEQARDSMAFDKSMRTLDVDGRMHVAKSHISKAMVSPYRGDEIPGAESLGLNPETVYYLLRDPAELEKAAPTFARLPILKRHVPITADSFPTELVIGATGSDVEFKAPYLDADLVFWTAQAIAEIEADAIKELSCAYHYVPVMEPGIFEGTHYDGRMTQIVGNHVAKVEDGRAGSDVVVADENPFKGKAKMVMTKLGNALFKVCSALSPKLAADAALGAIVGRADKKLDRGEAVKKLVALDAELSPEQLDGVLDAIIGVQDDPKPMETPSAIKEPEEEKGPLNEGAGDEGPEEKIRALLAGKVDDEIINAILAMFPKAPAEDCSATSPAKDAKEEGGEPEVKKSDMKAAMDSLRRDLIAGFEAANDVRAVLGDIKAGTSAVEAYGMALDSLGVERTGIKDVTALRALFKLAQERKPQVDTIPLAQDSAELAKTFPNAMRFRTV